MKDVYQLVPQLRQSASRRTVRVTAAVLVVALVAVACRPALFAPSARSYSAVIAVRWFDLSLNLVRDTPGFTPPVASRAFGYLGVALYESIRPGLPGYRSLRGQLNELTIVPRVNWWAAYHWPSAANAALASLMRRLFPTASPANLSAIDALEEELAEGFMAEVKVATHRRSAAYGRAVADAIFAWSLTDGGHEGYTRNFPEDYAPRVGPGLWVNTPPVYAKAMQPDWGNNRPFVLPDANGCPAPEPLTYSEDIHSPFYLEALEVYQVGLLRTPEQTAIAKFWSDDPGRTATPAGHWIAILNRTLTNEDADLGTAAEAYAKLGIAVADAFITCWHTKYTYNVLRPITYIQAVIDPNWNNPNITDPVTTPPFPEYTSGHSVQSGAAAAVLTALFGGDYAFTDESRADLDLPPRTFASFHTAAAEAAISRLYGGIHYRSAIQNGLAQGHCVGERVLALRFKR
jgi:hypothetical protein